MTDVKRLIAEVAARNGIRIEPEDPAFCLVTLNQLILEEAGRDVADEIRTATKHLQESVKTVEGRVGVILARELKQTLSALRSQADREPRSRFELRKTNVRSSTNVRSRMAYAAISILIASLIFGCGVLVGIAIH
jgi:hypothetical protein